MQLQSAPDRAQPWMQLQSRAAWGGVLSMEDGQLCVEFRAEHQWDPGIPLTKDEALQMLSVADMEDLLFHDITLPPSIDVAGKNGKNPDVWRARVDSEQWMCEYLVGRKNSNPPPDLVYMAFQPWNDEMRMRMFRKMYKKKDIKAIGTWWRPVG